MVKLTEIWEYWDEEVAEYDIKHVDVYVNIDKIEIIKPINDGLNSNVFFYSGEVVDVVEKPKDIIKMIEGA